MAKAIALSGSYMLFERHAAAPPTAAFDAIKLDTPNCSGRMDNLRAAILRPQLAVLDDNANRWNKRYDALADALAADSRLRLPERHPSASEVPSSLQFFIGHFNDDQNAQFLSDCLARGVELKWFGAAEPAGYTSRYDSWHYIQNQPTLAQTGAVLKRLYDCRLPLTFSVADCQQIGRIVCDVVGRLD